MITDKQKKAIKFIESKLDVEYYGGTNGHEAYEFIKEYLPKAQSKCQIIVPVCSVELACRDKVIRDDIDFRFISEDDINTVCSGGIHCADDINEYAWLFSMPGWYT